MLCSSLWGVGPTIVIHDALAGLQTDRPTMFGYCFKQGDYANVPKPLIGGVAPGSSDWQVHVTTRWADTSAKCAIIAFNQTISANSFITVTFANNANGNETGYLTQAQMLAFNNGGAGWGGEMDVTFNGVTKTADAATMLADNDPGAHALPGASLWGDDGLNDYWFIGPVVTVVIVRDGSSASKWDFGAKWDGTTMNLNSGSAYTGNSTYASQHPWHILYFFPKNNSVRDDQIIETIWTGRWQDQLFDIVYKTGATPSAQLTQTGSRIVSDAATTIYSNVVTSATANFTSTDVGMPVTIDSYLNTTICSVTNSTTVKLCETAVGTASSQPMSIGLMHAGQRARVPLWTGTGAPGDVLIDYDQDYMASAGVFPPYDNSVSVSPDSMNAGPALNTSYEGSGLGDYATFAGGTQTNVQNPSYCAASGSPCRFSDSGARGGTGGLVIGFAGNNEGAPTQLEDANYLFNMRAAYITISGGNGQGAQVKATVAGGIVTAGTVLNGGLGYATNPTCTITATSSGSGATCTATAAGGVVASVAITAGGSGYLGLATTNGLGAKAWYMLTGTRGAKHSGLAASIVGQAGMWGNWGNVPFAARESATVNGYYSAAQASKDAVVATAFGSSTGTAINKPISRYNRPTATFTGAVGVVGNPSGTVSSLGGWSAGGCDHMLNYSFVPALLLGDYYKVEEQQMWASYCAATVNGGAAYYQSNGFYAYISTVNDGLRQPAWSLQEIYRAALVSPDLTAEQLNYDSLIKSNAEVQAGAMNLTSDATITPTNHRACDAWNYDYTTANRWEWGRCTVASFFTNTGSPASSAGVTQALHNLSPGFCTWQYVGNGGLVSGYITAASSVSSHTTLTGALPTTATTITIIGATGNWAGINANWVVSNVTGSTFDVAFDSSAVVGALTGHLTWTQVGFGQITAISKASHAVLTGNMMPGSGTNTTLYGITGTGWSGLNGTQVITNITATTGSIVPDSSGFSGSAGGTIYYSNLVNELDKISSSVEPWMESMYTVVLGEMGQSGFTYFNSVASEANKWFTEAALDNTYNPYLLGTYSRANKGLTGSQYCGANVPSPYLSTYASVLQTYVPLIQTLNSYDTTNFLTTTACDDHSYPLVARAAVQYAGLTTGSCTQGTCLGTDAVKLMDAITPYFNNSPTNSTGCGSFDGGIKFALSQPNATPAVTITACNSLSPSSATIAVLGTQAFTADCTYSDASTGDCTASLSLSSGTPSVATVSSQTATGVSGGSSTISGTAGGFACGNTSALTVTAATSFSSFKGLTLKGVTVK